MIGYISIQLILDDILTHPLLRDLPLERAVNYAQQLIRIVGSPKMFEEKTAVLEIKDYRAALPCDCVEVVQVQGDKGLEFRYTTDNFHMAHHKDCPRNVPDLTYKIQGNIIYTSIEEGTIEISYASLSTDNDGFPLIPDNSSFIKALELYIKVQWFTILFDMNKISSQALQNAQQQYAWYIGQAQSDLIRPSVDEMQSITNMWNTLVPRTVDHKMGFKNSGTREYIRQQ